MEEGKTSFSSARPKETNKTKDHHSHHSHGSRRRRHTSSNTAADPKISKSSGGRGPQQEKSSRSEPQENEQKTESRSHNSHHRSRHHSSKPPIWGIQGHRCQPSPVERILRNRNWHYTKLGHDLNHQETALRGLVTFSVASYNVLSQDLLKANIYLYEGAKKENLDWNYRCRNLLNEIIFRQPDILCVQEMHFKHYRQFYDELHKKGYTGVYQKRTGADKQDGCAIFYQVNKFELHHSACVEYYRQAVPALDRDNVAIVLLLRVKGSDQLLCVATTHILFNPRRGDVKLAQLMVLLSEIDRLAHKGFDQVTCEPLYHSIILCGDFNLVPLSHLYQFLSRGYLRYEGLSQNQMSGQEMHGYFQPINKHFLSENAGLTQSCQQLAIVQKRLAAMTLQSQRQPPKQAEIRKKTRLGQSSGNVFHSFPLVSVYTHNSKQGEVEVTTHHSQGACTVDYMWFSTHKRVVDPQTCKVKSITQGPLKLIGSLALPSVVAMNEIGILPNEVVSSDHVMLMAKFALSQSA